MSQITREGTTIAAKLTKEQNRLLAYPPKPTSWECSGCHMINPEKRALCWMCDKRQPRRAKHPTPYERYLAACKAAGREPIQPKEASQ